jgi:hypothetical protein
MRRSGRAGRQRRNLVEDGSRCQSPSPGDCEVAVERMAGRKTDDSVRFRDGSTRSIKEGPQMARGVYSDQSANGSRAHRAMASQTDREEIARQRWSESACGARNLMPPFPGAVIMGNGTGAVKGTQANNLQKRKIVCLPLRALDCSGTVPEEAGYQGKGAHAKARKPAGADLDIWPNCGQQGYGGCAPATPLAKK